MLEGSKIVLTVLAVGNRLLMTQSTTLLIGPESSHWYGTIVASGIETLLLVHGKDANPVILKRAWACADELAEAVAKEDSKMTGKIQIATYYSSATVEDGVLRIPFLNDPSQVRTLSTKTDGLAFIWFNRGGTMAQVLETSTKTGLLLQTLARHSPLLKPKTGQKKTEAHRSLIRAMLSVRKSQKQNDKKELVRQRRQTHMDWLILMNNDSAFKFERPVVDVIGDYGVLKHTHLGTRSPGARTLMNGDTVAIHYLAMNIGGTVVDDSMHHSKSQAPLEFILGRMKITKCLEKGVASMAVGERAILLCAPEYSYNEAPAFVMRSSGVIGDGKTLRLDVEIVGIHSASSKRNEL